jgi:hypothetical protein
MRTFKVTIEGVAPLRMNKFTEESKNTLQGGRKKLSKAEQIQEAYERTYKNEKGQYIIPINALKACILDGAKKVPLGRGKAKKDARAVIFPLEDMVLTHSEPVISETVVRIPPVKGAMAVKYHIVFKEWSGSTKILITDDRFPEEVLKLSLQEAGMYAGILDGRPDFGRFILKEFEQVK